MESLSKIAAREGFGPKRRTCGSCHSEFDTYVTTISECVDCIEKKRRAAIEVYRAKAREKIGVLVERRLKELGLGAVERSAEERRIPREILRAVPPDTIARLLAGQRPRGFGLSGGQGIGKTMAVAALLKKGLYSLVSGRVDLLTDLPSPGSENSRWWAVGRLRWASWPERAAWMKGRISIDDHRGVEEWVLQACSTPLLILDDLGRERMRGSYQEDFSAGHLDRIIDARSREQLPVFWTSNLDVPGLIAFYGSAMTSRLLGLAPVIDLPAMRDLRLSPLAAVS
jgi:hypothetical protein